MRKFFLALILLATATAGCFGGDGGKDGGTEDRTGEPPRLPDGLGIQGAKFTHRNETSAALMWNVTVSPQSSLFHMFAEGYRAVEPKRTALELPASVDTAVRMELSGPSGFSLELDVRDEALRGLCLTSTSDGGPAACEFPWVPDADGPREWSVQPWILDAEQYEAEQEVPLSLEVHVEARLPAQALDSPVVHGPDGDGLPVSDFPGDVPVFVQRDVSGTAYEPTLGIDSDGRAFYLATPPLSEDRSIFVHRSEDQGRTWEDVSPRIAGEPMHREVGDPYLQIDPATGRIWALDAIPFHAEIAWSDDDGESWTMALVPGTNDHETLFVGPPPAGTATLGYPNVLYLCWNDVGFPDPTLPVVGTVYCQTSLDGGAGFLGPVEVFVEERDAREPPPGVSAPYCGVVANGRGATSPVDGTAYLPQIYCDVVLLHVSQDGGLSWDTLVVDDTIGATERGVEMWEGHVSVDAEGNVYYLWIAEDNLPRLTYSKDQGTSWSDPVTVAAPGITASRMPGIVAGDEGRLAFYYYGLVSGLDEPERWDAYIGVSLDALVDEPVFATIRVNGPDDPLHLGPCYFRCGGLIDFIDLDMDPTTGRLWVSLMDTCTQEACPPFGSPSDSMVPLRSASASVGVQVGGSMLRQEANR